MDSQIASELARRLAPKLSNAGERIGQLSRDEAFRDMCSEYEQCTRSLQYWSESPAESGERVEEYTGLLRGLEEEILRHLQDRP